MDPGLILLVAVGVLVAIFIGTHIRFRPVRWGSRAVLHVFIGIFLLFVVNMLGTNFAFHLPINVYTVAVAAILGLPGVLGLCVIEWWIL